MTAKRCYLSAVMMLICALPLGAQNPDPPQIPFEGESLRRLQDRTSRQLGPKPEPTPEQERWSAPSSTVSGDHVSKDRVDRHTSTVPTIEFLEARLQETGEIVDENVQTDVVKRLQNAMTWLNQAAEARAREVQFHTDIDQAPLRRDRAIALLAQELPEAEALADPSATLTRIEAQVAVEQQQLEDLKQQLEEVEREVRSRERKVEITLIIEQAHRGIEQIRRQTAQRREETAAQLEARRAESSALVYSYQSQISLLETELLRIDALADYFRTQRDLLVRNISYQQRLVSEWRRQVSLFRQKEASRQAEEARNAVGGADPAVRRFAERNAELAELRTDLTPKLDAIPPESKLNSDRVDDLKGDLAKIQQKVEVAGHTTTIGLLLRKKRDQLPSTAALKDRLRFVESEMPLAQLVRIELDEEREEVIDIDSALEESLAGLTGLVEKHGRDTVEKMVTELFDTRRRLLNTLIDDYDAYIDALSELELSARRLVNQIDEYTAYINEHVLWVRSTHPLSRADFVDASRGLDELAQPKQWGAAADAVWGKIQLHPLMSGLCVVVWVVLYVGRYRMRSALREQCDSQSREKDLSVMATLRAFMLTMGVAGLWPLLLSTAGWYLSVSSEPTGLAHALGPALQHISVVLWALEVFRLSCRPGGIAEHHFPWGSAAIDVIRSNIRWAIVIGLPMLVAVEFSKNYQGGLWQDSLGRLTFIIAMFVLAIYTHRMVQSIVAAIHLPDGHDRSPQDWKQFALSVARLFAVALPVVLALMSAIGYHFSAEQVAQRAEYTILLILGVILAHGFLSSWIAIVHDKLAYIAERETDASEVGSDENEPKVTSLSYLETLTSQVSRLVRSGVGVAVLVGMWFVWSDMVPAIKILERVELWSKIEEQPVTVASTTGEQVTQLVEKEVPVTLLHVLAAGAVVVLTIAATRNIPGLLEMSVLCRFPLDRGAKHAIAILSRYALSLAGFMVMCPIVGLRWSSIQWFVAAMTVGLGFGLQEIFANLVSGLIILVERPVRVGDFVSVGGVSGTVTRMQMRATTITDLDRREMLVPNRKFITDDVINWTLSDPVTRTIVPVGIAYGADTKTAHAILVRIAEEHPLVVAEPHPSAVFTGFGDSTLDFELRFFIPRREVYPLVLHEINMAIDQEFRKAGIEIAFPQQDVTIRNADALAPLLSHRRDAA